MRALCSPILLLATTAWVMPACTGTGPETPTLQEVLVEAGPDVTVAVGEEIVLDGRESSEGQAVWHMGDGTSFEGNVGRHTYTEPGNYVAVLEVTGPGGLTRSDSVRVTAYLPATATPPAHTSTVVFDPEGRQIFVTEPDADLVAVVDVEGAEVTYIPTCTTPRTMALRGSELGITCEGSDELLVIDTTTYEETRTWGFGTGTRPYGVAGRGNQWWVSGHGRGELIATEDLTSDRVLVGSDPRAIAVSAEGEIFATRFRSESYRGLIYRFDDEPIPLSLDPGPDTTHGNRGVPNLLGSLLISPDGATAYVAGLVANIERGSYRDGEPLTAETLVHATVRTLDLTGTVTEGSLQTVIGSQGEISAMALSPLGNWLWVAHPGTGTLHRLDAYTLDVKGAILDVGHQVDGITLSDDGSILYAHASLDRILAAYDVGDPSKAPELLWTAATVDTEPLDPRVLLGKQLFHDASDTRMALGGLQRCASCHPDGGEDGQVWDFTDRGEGLRNTISLQGRGGTDMGLLGWTGNADEVQDFEALIRHGQGGTGLMRDADWDNEEVQHPLGDLKTGLSDDLDALAAYVHSLTETPVSPFVTTGPGVNLFIQRDCSSCHVPDQLYTDSAFVNQPRHDIGTQTAASGRRIDLPFEGFDTPTLLGVWATGPYLHDGSALTLEQAIGSHDYMSGLGTEIVQLAAYVRTL